MAAGVTGQSFAPEPPNAPVVLDALARAYPGRVESPAIRHGDWSVLVGGRTFLWAGGRMLPEEERDAAGRYMRHSFLPYPREMPDTPILDEEQVRALEERIRSLETRSSVRNQAFLEALWPGMESFESAERTVESTSFLGWKIRIHPGIAEPLARVDAAIRWSAEEDPEISAWLDDLAAVGAYVWRDIAGSGNRSLHSFGIAVDMVPRNYGGRPAYWRWARDVYDEWWAVPQEERYPVPAAVVEAFEAQGFTWGGKWFLYDRIHFEYRPELFLIPEGAAPVSRRGS